jgi:polysaccharide biosynthesis protein PslG
VAYGNLLKAIYPAIKGVDPGAQVLVAGLVSPEPAVSFLSAIAANGGWNSFDILSVHPYTDPKGSEEGQIGAASIGQVKTLADRLGAKPIWATEFG